MFTVSWNVDFDGIYNPSNPNGESFSFDGNGAWQGMDDAFEYAETLDCDGAFNIVVRNADHQTIYEIPNVRNN